MTSADCLERLNAFDPSTRRAALDELSASAAAPPAAGTNVNMHLHSFFSFNAMGYSPSRLAWEARCQGLYAAGLCDFDVLDGLDEFLDAGRRLGLRVAVGLETRAFFDEYAADEISSPGEPGITYIMGAGFPRNASAASPAGRGLAEFRARAIRRNRELLARINARLPDLAVDYQADVLPLSPADCPTERHIVRAYAHKAAGLGADATARIWSQILQKPVDAMADLLTNRPAFEEAVRARLIKRGGLAYEQPTRASFPSVDNFVRWVLAARAIPMATWLDGTSAGERDPAAMLECLQAKGVAAVNIIPDRNWNLRNPEEQRQKTANLREFVGIALAMNLPINIGTEMNKDGQPFYDDLGGPVLKEFAAAFLDGARIMVGQTLLARYADYAYCDERVVTDFKGDRRRQNTFFADVGALPPLPTAAATALEAARPAEALDLIRTAVRHGNWGISPERTNHDTTA